jgi:hypothetical protein
MRDLRRDSVKDEEKTKQQLLAEVLELSQRVAALEAADAELQRATEALRLARFAIDLLEQDVQERVDRGNEWARANRGLGRLVGFDTHLGPGILELDQRLSVRPQERIG